MIRHIFKKDWKLLWPFVVAVAAVWWIEALILFRLGLVEENPLLLFLSNVLTTAAVFGTMFLLVALIHLDALPGLRQDWLVRPIPRGTMLVEKLLFALVLVIGPVFAANVFQGTANGFSVTSVLGHAAVGAAIFVCIFVLPFSALACVTENMTAAFILGSVCAAAGSVLLVSLDQLNHSAHGMIVTTANSGIGWLVITLQLALAAIGAAAILFLQYFRKKTLVGRFMLGCVCILLLAVQLLPWKPAFAIESLFSTQPNAAASVALAFDPDSHRFKSPSGIAGSSQELQPNRGEQFAAVFLPLKSSGIPGDSILLSDRVDVHVMGGNGRPIYSGVGHGLQIEPGAAVPEGAPVYQQIELQLSSYSVIKANRATLRLDYSLTLFKIADTYSLPALNGSGRSPALGFCQTETNESETAVELHCMRLGERPVCATLFLENAATGVRNPPTSACFSRYGLAHPPIPDVMARYGGGVRFRDPSGLAKYPVDGSQLAQSRIVIRVYQPVDHFTRSLEIPAVRLDDWQAQ